MRYIKNEVIPLPKLIVEGSTDQPATLPSVLRKLAGDYTPSDALRLNLKELRVLNAAMDILEAKPEDGYFGLEDEHFEVLCHIVESYATRLALPGVARDIPVLLDALSAAPSVKPKGIPESLVGTAPSTELLDPSLNSVKPKAPSRSR